MTATPATGRYRRVVDAAHGLTHAVDLHADNNGHGGLTVCRSSAGFPADPGPVGCARCARSLALPRIGLYDETPPVAIDAAGAVVVTT